MPVIDDGRLAFTQETPSKTRTLLTTTEISMLNRPLVQHLGDDAPALETIRLVTTEDNKLTNRGVKFQPLLPF